MKPGQDRIVSHTDAEWTSMDPVLADGEIGINRNGGRMKYGNGVDSWSKLPYLDQNFASVADVAGVAAQLDDVRTRVEDVRTKVDDVRTKVDALEVAPVPIPVPAPVPASDTASTTVVGP